MEQAVGRFGGIFEDRVLAWRRVVPLARLCHIRLAARWRLAVWPIVGCVLHRLLEPPIADFFENPGRRERRRRPSSRYWRRPDADLEEKREPRVTAEAKRKTAGDMS